MGEAESNIMGAEPEEMRGARPFGDDASRVGPPIDDGPPRLYRGIPPNSASDGFQEVTWSTSNY